MKKPIGLVLAGGAGRRLGRSKADLRLQGVSLASRAATKLVEFCSGVLVSVPPGADNPAPGFAALEDAAPAGRGPLAGLDAAFGATSDADLLVLACDYPHVGPKLLRAIVTQGGDEPLTLVSGRDGRDHPLVALWGRPLAGPVRRAVERGAYRVRDLVAEVRVCRIGSERLPEVDLERELVNVNRPQDLDALDGAD